MFSYESYDVPMDLGGEVGAVANCVAGVTSAFENSAAILNRIKQRRAAGGGPPLPRMLEESIFSAPDEIQRERLRGVVRFGEQFEVGDLRAVVALQQITIQLQNNLLNKLLDIEDGDANIAALAEAADRGRDNTITCLIGLRQRLAGHQEIIRTVSDTSTSSITSPITPRSPPMNSPPFPPAMTSPTGMWPSRVPPPIPGKSHERVMSYYEPSSFNSRFEEPRFTYREVEEDQFEIQSARSSTRTGHDSSSSSVYSSLPRPPSNSDQTWVNTSAGRSESTPNIQVPHRPSSISAFPWTTKSTQARSSSSGSIPPPLAPLAPIQTYPLNFTSSNVHPCAQNNYLGFCKTAWKLQCGDEKALNKAKDFQHSVHSKYHFLTCSRFRCEFKGKGTDALTNRVITDSARGLKYRWSFLAKSHVFMKSVTDEQYSYLCMFCVFAGGQQVVMNATALLDHISQIHRAEKLSDVQLDRTSAVQGRVCRDGEKFDMNLFTEDDHMQVPRDSGVYRPFSSESPGGAEERAELSGRKRSEVAELPGRRQSEVAELAGRRSSAVGELAAERWNESRDRI